MDYDADKTDLILKNLHEAVNNGRMQDALHLLQQADAGGKLRSDTSVLASLKAEVGEDSAAEIVNAFAREACLVCRGGREKCEDCAGKGYTKEITVCSACAGLGHGRCPYCNGTALAGYDFVPRGLRPAVLAKRLEFAREQLKSLTKPPDQATLSAKHIVLQILSIDRCRGILANAVEQATINEVGTTGGQSVYSTSSRIRIEGVCQKYNAEAEQAISRLLGALSLRMEQKARRPDPDQQHQALFAERARMFATLSRKLNFGDSALSTPRSLRGH